MKRFPSLLFFFLQIANSACGKEFPAPPSEKLLAVCKEQWVIRTGIQAAFVENAELKQDAATFTVLSGRQTFPSPVAGRAAAMQFREESGEKSHEFHLVYRPVVVGPIHGHD